jgi:hypothetical protein
MIVFGWRFSTFDRLQSSMVRESRLVCLGAEVLKEKTWARADVKTARVWPNSRIRSLNHSKLCLSNRREANDRPRAFKLRPITSWHTNFDPRAVASDDEAFKPSTVFLEWEEWGIDSLAKAELLAIPNGFDFRSYFWVLFRWGVHSGLRIGFRKKQGFTRTSKSFNSSNGKR